MSAIFNIYKDLYLNSNKSSKKTIFSKSTTNNSYNKNSHFNLFKNISLIKPKYFMVQKKSKKKTISKNENNHIFRKLKFINPPKTKNKNNKTNYKRNNIICSPCYKSNSIRKKLILRNNTSNSNSLTLSKPSIDQKNNRKMKNENKILLSFKKEKNLLNTMIDKQKIEIEKLKNKSIIYNQKLLLLEKENKTLNKKIEDYSNNQDQLILLIKIIQACGVDIDNLIDEYNNNINNDYLYDNSSKSFTDNESISELDIKAESNSFIPITLEKEHKTKISKIKIPKLNLDKINKKNLYNINFNNNKK